jgi:hypothetical protein
VRDGFLVMVTMVVLSLLDVLHLVINTSLGEIAVLSLRRATDHAFSLMVVVTSNGTGVVFPWWF